MTNRLPLLLLSSLALAAALTTGIPMCPCVQTGTQCQKFDRRYQAHTLEEAKSAFPDLTVDKDPLVLTTLEEDEACTTQECTDCRNMLSAKLRQVGLDTSVSNPLTTPDLTNTTCAKYRFASPEESQSDEEEERPMMRLYNEPSTSLPPCAWYGKHRGKKSHDGSSEDSDDDDDDDEDEDKKKKERDERKERKERERKYDYKHEKRERRQAAPPAAGVTGDGTIIGTRYPLSCTAKGAATDASGKISLCSSCWVWRKLPDNYSPQYVNELICDTSDTACLSGYATCSAGTHSIEVVRNDSGVLSTVALSAGAYCECKVNVNSAIQTLVLGTGLTGGVPAVAAPAAGK